jgi:glycosyltransferase involved in cell wall biosynthesis
VNQKKISLVMPVYNAAGTIEKVVDSYYAEVIQKLPGSEFIIAEDGSNDGTKEILAKLAKKYKIRLVSGKERKGYIKAVQDALKLPKNELIFLSDSDGEHSAKDFWNLLELSEEADLVIGFKKNRKPFYRTFISKLNNFLIGLFFGLWLHDANCGFRLLKKPVVSEISQKTGTLNYASNAEFVIRAFKAGYKIKETGVSHSEVESVVFPITKMPKVILIQLLDLVKLWFELRNNKSKNNKQ